MYEPKQIIDVKDFYLTVGAVFATFSQLKAEEAAGRVSKSFRIDSDNYVIIPA